MTGDRAIRRLAAAVVLAVAGFAAIVSYSHIYDLGRAHGQAGTAARLLPLSVDGLILAASLVLLHEARNGRPAPALARCMLALGVGATVAANVAYGLAFGPLGAVISAWPAVAFIGSAEMAIGMVRRARSAAPEPASEVHPQSAPALNGSAHPGSAPGARDKAHPEAPSGAPRTRTASTAGKRTRGAAGRRTRSAPVTAQEAEAEFMADLASGSVPSLRAIRTRLHVGQDRARQIQADLCAMTTAGASTA